MPSILSKALYPMAVALFVVACDDGVRPPPPPSIALAPQSHSIQVGETLQVTAIFSDPSGQRDGSSVSWTTLDGTVAAVSVSGLVTGLRPGTARIVGAAAGAADTTRIQVVQTPAVIEIDPIPSLEAGGSIQLQATVFDTEGEEMVTTVEWSVSPLDLATVDGAGVLTALAEGMVTITASAAPVVATFEAKIGKAVPVEGCESGGAQLAVGEVRRYEGGDPLALCLAGGAEYALVAANAGAGFVFADFAAVGTSAPAAGIAASLSPARAVATAVPSAPGIDREFERRLRRRERDRLSPRGGRTGMISRSLQTTTSTAVGDLLELNTSTSCEATELRTGRVEYVGDRAIVVADTSNPAGLTRSDYARFGVLYDTLLYTVVTEHFGEPAAMNGESRAVIFYTRAVNELTERDADGVVGGFFWAGDLFPRGSCAASNERGMFYMLAADPQGAINGNVRSVEYVERATAGTIAHELQHLINASRRIFVNDAEEWEEPWLNEGLSHIAEELVFYRVSGLSARSNLGAPQLGSTQARVDVTNRYALSNLLRMDRYLREVERQGPFQSDDDLATRGASWQFLRYAIDRHGGDPRALLADLVDSHTNGLGNLEGVFGIDAREWFADDAVSLYVDDAVNGIGAEHRHPSWNFRSVFDWLNRDDFVLPSHVLSGGEAASVRLAGWGTAYMRAAVDGGKTGRIDIGTTDSPPATALKFSLTRTR